MSEDNPQTAALDWLRERGGSAAIARTKAGGRVILAQGETAPFTPATIKKLVEAGAAVRRGGHVEVTVDG